MGHVQEIAKEKVIEFSEKWLSKKIMCGIACGYGCCNSPTFKVTSEEQERTSLQEKYKTSPKEIEPQNGHCRFLKSDDTGCMFGEDRPSGCKIFPLEVRNNRLGLSNWYGYQCPKPESYEFVRKENGKYMYRYKENLRKHRNKKREFSIDYPIENIPPAYILMKNEIKEQYGEELWNRIDLKLKGKHE